MNHHILTGKVDVTSNLLVGSSHLFVDTTNNRVGLVTADPDAGLHVNSNAYVNTDLRVGSQIEINTTPGRVKATSFEGDGSLLVNAPVGSLAVHSTDTGLPGTNAIVTNEGTPTAAEFKFVIPRGDVGATGTAATVSVGTTTTGAAGSSASVTNTGSSTAAVFDFTVPRGDQGIQGVQGIQGDTGTAATVAAGTTTTGAAGTNASVTNTGSSSAASFDFIIPRGDTGATGPAGTVAIGTTTTGAAGSSASVTNTGTSTAATLEFTIPKGDQGIQGIQGIQGVQGDTGPAGTVAIGTTTTGAAGSSASVTNTGTSTAANLEFTIPKGDQGIQGPAATIAVGTTTTGASGTNASVTNSGSSSAAVFDFTVPRGADGTNYFTLSGSDIYRSTGNVGIGTTSPTRALDVSTTGSIAFGDNIGVANERGLYWSSASDYSIYRTSEAWSSPNYAQLKLDWPTGIVLRTARGTYGKSFVGVDDRMSIGASYHTTKSPTNGLIVEGNVGIGTISPGYKLHVYDGTAQASWRNFYVRPTSLWGDGLTTASETAGTKYMTANMIMLQGPHITPSSTGGNAYIRYGRAGGIQSGVWWETACVTDGSFRIRREANDSYGMTINSSGNVGIGTISPGYKLEVNGTSLFNGEMRWGLGNTSHAGHSTNKDWYIRSGSSSGKVIIQDSGGDVGIGTASPGAKLHVNGNAYISSTLESDGRIYADNGCHVRGDWLRVNGNAGIYFESYGGGWWMTDSTYIRNYNSKMLLIEGSGARIYGLEATVNYSSSSTGYRAVGLVSDPANYDFSLYVDKSVRAAGFVAFSDRRIKSNVVDINDTYALEQVRKLKPKYYDYVDKAARGDSSVIGFIAQEVKEVVPRAVSVSDGDVPNIYETGNIGPGNTITFTKFDTSTLESSTKTLIVYLSKQDRKEVTVAEIIDKHTLRVEEDISEWGRSMTEDGKLIYEEKIMTVTPEEYKNLEDKMGYEPVVTGYSNGVDTISMEEYDALDDKTGYSEFIGHYEINKKIYEGTEIFVWGQKVNDFHHLNKDYLWTIGTAALQEVDRQLQEVDRQLQAEKVKTKNLEALVLSLITRVQKIETR